MAPTSMKPKHALKQFQTSKKLFKPKSRLDNVVKSKAMAMQLEDDAHDFPRGGGSSLSLEELNEVRAEVYAEFEAEGRGLKKKRRIRKQNISEDGDLGSLFGGVISSKSPRFANRITWKVGLCHVSEFSDDHVENIETKCKAGERVTTKVLKVDEERYLISLGMKDSYFTGSDEIQAPSKQNSGGAVGGNDILHNQLNMLLGSGSYGIPNLKTDLENGEHPILDDIEAMTSILPLEVSLDDIENSGMDDVLSCNKERVDSVDTGNEKCKRQAKKKANKEREREIRAAEEKLVEKDIPRSADEFEKMVRSSPNSSFVWIKFMAFMLSLADVENARSIAERALKTINIREESEKLNIWVAYFNLENEYGNPPEESVQKIFHRALQYCDPKRVHLSLLGMYERTQQHKLSDELLNKMLRKFKHSCKVWLRRIQWLLKQQNKVEIQSVVKRAVVCLPRHKHMKFLSQTALFEFKCGVPDRARSMFEGMLREYPKRTDLWSIYLDQEIRLGDADIIRALFERAISLALPPKKMKFLFKKYLEYENSVGVEERIESVKQKAMEYVETTTLS